jgi:predicted RNA binding protein YcfA (HicA-like mRNA interferase family)
MGIKPVPTRKFLRFLKSKGVVYIRSEASHDIYDNPQQPLFRPIVVRTKYKDVPLLHIHTSLENIGVSKKEFEEWMKKN